MASNKTVFFIIGILLIILGGFMLIPYMAQIFYGEKSHSFLSSAFITIFIGSLFAMTNLQKNYSLNLQQTFFFSSFAWISVAIFGSFPFLFSNLNLSISDAFFESMSGITTTGSTIIEDLDNAPKSLLLWRAIMQWLGGIGIIVMAITVLPLLKVGGMQLFKMESSDKPEKILPRTIEVASIIISVSSGIGKGSARSIYGFDIGSNIIGAVQAGLLVKGGGHKMAAGFTIDMKKIEAFKEFLFRKFKSVNMNLEDKKNYFFDTQIAPSAVNLTFFEKINLLAPFGSGNLEPRFLIEGLKVVNSKIVGEKHIKSVLLGSDSSIIKAISFNSVDTDLSAYLLNKNTKTLNIVGKLSLNEWRGQKNVEFIIDDISVIK